MYNPEDQRARVEARQEKIRRWRPADQPIRHPFWYAFIGIVAGAALFAAGYALLH